MNADFVDTRASAHTDTDPRQSWQILIPDLAAGLHRFLYRLVGEVAEDLCHEAFLRAIRKAPLGLPAAQAKPLLYRIAKNLAIDHSRKRQRRRQALLQSLSPAAASPVLPDQQMDRRQLLRLVNAFAATLPQRQYLALTLRLYHGMSYTEMATILGGTEAAARANVYQALKKIRARYAKMWEEIR